MKNLNSKGMTLVEVLAVTIIAGIVSLLIINILSNIISHKDNIATTSQVRDVADIYLESLTRSLYSLNEDKVCGEIKQSLSEGGYYISDCTDGTKKVTGFKKDDVHYSLYIKGKKIDDTNPNIIISDETKMQKDGNIYLITLVLEYNNQKKTFNKEVHSIPSS